MRGILGRLLLTSVFWFCILDTFIGRLPHLWIWTLGLIAAFFLAEGTYRLGTYICLKRGPNL